MPVCKIPWLITLVVVIFVITPAPAQESGRVQHELITPQKLELALDLPCPELSFDGATESTQLNLASFTRLMAELMTAEAGFPIYILPDRRELKLDGIADLSDVQIRPLTVSGGRHSFRYVLALVAESTNDPVLTFLPRERHILVTTSTAAELDENMSSQAYSVSDLLSQIRDDGLLEGQMTLMGPLSAADTVIRVLQNHTVPVTRWFNIHGEGGQISQYGDSLVIRQDYHSHRRIRSLLSALREPQPLRRSVDLAAAPTSKLITRKHVERAWNSTAPVFYLHSQDGEIPNADQFLSFMQRQMSQATGIPVRIHVDRTELELDGVSELRHVPMRPLLIASETRTFGEILEFATRRCLGSKPEYGFMPREQDILFSTRAALEFEAYHETVVYDLRGLLKRLNAANHGQLRILTRLISVEDGRPALDGVDGKEFLFKLIKEHGNATSRWLDVDGEGGRMSFCGDLLVLTQSWSVLNSIRKLLRDLDVAMSGG